MSHCDYFSLSHDSLIHHLELCTKMCIATCKTSSSLFLRTQVTRALYEVVVDGVRQECVYGDELTEFTASLKTELATIVDNHGAPLEVSLATLESTSEAITLFTVDFNEQISGSDLNDVLERLCDARDKEFPGM